MDGYTLGIIQSIVSGILEGSIYALLGLSVSVVIGVTRIVSVAHGDIMVLAGYASFWLFVIWGVDPFFSLVLTLPLFFALGILLQRTLLITSLSAEVWAKFQGPLLITYGIGLLIMSSELAVWSPNYRQLITSYSFLSFSFFGISINFLKAISLVTALAVTAGFYFLLTKTEFGRAVRAISVDKTAAMLMGVNARRLSMLVFGISTMIAAITGMLYLITHVIHPSFGLVLGLKALTIVVVGGMGSIFGCLVAGLMLGIVENIGSFLISPAYKDAIAFAFLLFILIARPKGILGKGAEE